MPDITIQVNREERQVPEGCSVEEFVSLQDLPTQALLIERNEAALHRSQWSEVRLQAGDRLELLRIAAGG